jgi:energy-coupling factor transporter ATP-binding protein EcfA2
MILRRVQVEGWGCFVNPVEVGTFDERLNVLFGPNGTGKSTLLEVMTRGLMDTYSVGGAEAQSLRPWGRALTPKVTVEFAHAGLEFRLRKRFLDRPAALLEVHENGGWTRLAENEAADRHVRELLRAAACSAGLSSAKHWGIIQVLWAPQETVALPPLSGDVLADVHAALGVQISSLAGLELERRVVSLYHELYTTTGRLRSGVGEPLVVRLRRLKNEAEETLEPVRQQLRGLEAGRHRITALRERHQELRSEADRLTGELKKAQLELASHGALVAEKVGREHRMRAAEAEYSRVHQQLEALRECTESIAQAEEDLTAIEAELPEASERVAAGVRSHEAAAADLNKALTNQGRAWDAATEAALACRLVEVQDVLTNIRGRLQGAELAMLEIKRCRTAIAALHAPSREQLAEIRAAVKARDDARVRLESSLISLQLEPVVNASVRIISGDQTGEQAVPAGTSARITGSPAVEIEVAGFGRVRATGPAVSTSEYRRRFERATTQVHNLAGPFGTEDLGVLESVWAEGAALEHSLQATQGQLDAYRMDKSFTELQAERDEAQAKLEQIWRQEPSWVTEPPNVGALDEVALKLRQQSEPELRAAQQAAKLAQEALNEAMLNKAALVAREGRRRGEIQNFDRRLRSLRADGKSDALRHQELKQAALEWDAQKAAVEKLGQDLDAYRADPAAKVSALEVQADLAARERDEARDELRDEEARVRQVSCGAAYSALVAGEEKLEAILAKLRDEEVRTEAVSLLYKTVQACRAEAIASIPERVAETATSILERVAGIPIGAVCLSDQLSATGVSPVSLGAPVPLPDLSGGENEQLSFAVRLALAKELGRSERQLLVLDDSLTTTDSARFERILEILEESANELQILILTCHPERYTLLPGAKFHDLVRAAQQSTYTPAPALSTLTPLDITECACAVSHGTDRTSQQARRDPSARNAKQVCEN